MRPRLSLCLAALLAVACHPPTEFHGAPTIGGPAQCEQVCTGWGMEMAGMVQMGQYSDGCICRRRQEPPPAATSSADDDATFYAAAGSIAAAGVVMQMRAAEAQARRRQRSPYAH